jgi:NAD(P)-dependent dehydrogenase (short-subunit alcohol dehydrogenase family)
VPRILRRHLLEHAIGEQRPANHPAPETFKAKLKARAPINRWAQPVEIADAILWLASDEASFATGAMFTVDGGMTA